MDELPMIPWPEELKPGRQKCWCGKHEVTTATAFHGVGGVPICTNSCYREMLEGMERAEKASRGLYDS